MSVVGIVVVVALAIFAASILGAWLRGGTGGPQGDIKGIQEEMQRLLTTQAQGISAQMGQVSQLLSQHLTEVRRELEQGVTTASRITADAQRDMTDQLRNSTETMNRLAQHLGDVQKSGQELTQAAQTMQAVLGGPKSHGVVGEAQLETLLSDVLPKSAYEFDYEFSNGVMATAVLHSGRKLVAIDAEFPLDACRKVVEKGDEDARAEFAAAVRKHVDEVAGTYILPYEDTLDLALMFVPSESAFVELLLTQDEQGRLDDYCRQKHVLPVSPNSLHAYLSAVLVGLKGMEFEENAKRMLAGLDDVKKQFDRFAQAHAEFGSQLRQIQDTYEEASRRFASAQTALAATALTEPTQEAEIESEGAPAEPEPVQAANNGA
ncbi:MAG: DNA recombination protein RmuC [Acidobacteriota bacterium]|nr:DNA recombination protein RmuC [Acidobacteriota bacterium]